MLTSTVLSAGNKVKAAQIGPPPDDLKPVKDIRGNPRTRKQLIDGFWKGSRNVSGHVAFVANESDRERMRRSGNLMVVISDLSAQKVTVVGPASAFIRA